MRQAHGADDSSIQSLTVSSRPNVAKLVADGAATVVRPYLVTLGVTTWRLGFVAYPSIYERKCKGMRKVTIHHQMRSRA
jgi:hypothetical protein